MKFRTEIQIEKSPYLIEHYNSIATIGSCFAENIAQYLAKFRFKILNNPFGILYNPVSIYNALSLIQSEKKFTKDDLIQHDDLWHSWYHHSNFSHPNIDQCLLGINEQLNKARTFFNNCNFLIVTYGTAYVFELIESGIIVSNCHKIPSNRFKRFRMTVQDIENNISKFIKLAKALNPSIKIIFSVSPIRHLKDGMVENQLSKSSLLMALHHTIMQNDSCFYFPAYEIMIDDLRDYRFYESNLTHPSQMAIEYIWNKFSDTWLSEDCKSTIKDIDRLNKARLHKPLFTGSRKEQVFLKNQLKAINELKKKYPYIDFSEDRNYFNASLNKNID
jgi:hypothetical protein